VTKPDVIGEAGSAAIVSRKIVEQTVQLICSGASHAQCKMSNFCPFRSLVQVPGEKNSVLQRSQIMVPRYLEIVARNLIQMGGLLGLTLHYSIGAAESRSLTAHATRRTIVGPATHAT
jgi:hypothetical protein